MIKQNKRYEKIPIPPNTKAVTEFQVLHQLGFPLFSLLELITLKMRNRMSMAVDELFIELYKRDNHEWSRFCYVGPVDGMKNCRSSKYLACKKCSSMGFWWRKDWGIANVLATVFCYCLKKCVSQISACSKIFFFLHVTLSIFDDIDEFYSNNLGSIT